MITVLSNMLLIYSISMQKTIFRDYAVKANKFIHLEDAGEKSNPSTTPL